MPAQTLKRKYSFLGYLIRGVGKISFSFIPDFIPGFEIVYADLGLSLRRVLNYVYRVIASLV